MASVSPNAGPLAGSTYITLTGSGFTSTATVTLGGVAADVRFVSIDGTALEAWTPPHAKGPVNVVVTTPGGTATLPSGFTYLGVPIPALASTDCSAVITATNGVPIIVERAMYLDGAGLTFGAGHERAGVTAPAAAWFLAEGATGPYFDLPDFRVVAVSGLCFAVSAARPANPAQSLEGAGFSRQGDCDALVGRGLQPTG